LLDTDEQPLFDDLVRIFQALHVVDNNALNSIGGGGKPRVPMAARLCSDEIPFTPLKLKTDDSPQLTAAHQPRAAIRGSQHPAWIEDWSFAVKMNFTVVLALGARGAIFKKPLS
jgi:hypothetical protein